MARDVPVFVVCRDRVSCLRSLVDWLERAQHQRIYLVDNDSSYPPLLEYFATTTHTVIRLGENVGHLAAWEAGVVERFAADTSYIVTDPDVLPTEDCPLDVSERLLELLGRYPTFCKVGIGLKVDDLPDHYIHKKYVRAWEAQHWNHEIESGVYAAAVDTTFAIYRPGQAFSKQPALRTGPPYLARHLPWYSDGAHPTDEDRYYRAHASPSINTWNQERLPPKLDGYFHRSPWARIRRRVRSLRSDDA